MTSPPIITALYVPGDRPDRFDKAVATGAHLVIVDLEDAVSPDRKAVARDAVETWLSARSTDTVTRVEVRVNAGDHDDLAMVAGLGPSIGVRVPKVQSVSDLDAVAASVGTGRPITAMIETARGIEAIGDIASHPRVAGVTLGEADLTSDLGTRDESVLQWVRVRLLIAARAVGLPAPMMSVYPAIADLDGLRADTEGGRRIGFVGRTAVHPSQLAVIAAAFTPPADDVRWATEVLAATDGGGVERLASGDMVDPAMRGRAEAILSLAAATESADRPPGAR
jgi:citrate lyase subunit beta/citryl-CoA lyase